LEAIKDLNKLKMCQFFKSQLYMQIHDWKLCSIDYIVSFLLPMETSMGNGDSWGLQCVVDNRSQSYIITYKIHFKFLHVTRTE